MFTILHYLYKLFKPLKVSLTSDDASKASSASSMELNASEISSACSRESYTSDYVTGSDRSYTTQTEHSQNTDSLLSDIYNLLMKDLCKEYFIATVDKSVTSALWKIRSKLEEDGASLTLDTNDIPNLVLQLPLSESLTAPEKKALCTLTEGTTIDLTSIPESYS